MDSFKGRPRNLSYPSPPDRELLEAFKKPKKEDAFSRFKECPPTFGKQFDNKQKERSKPTMDR